MAGTLKSSSSTMARPTRLWTIVKAVAARHPMVHLLSNGTNRGKGYSVRNGMLRATAALSCSPTPISPPPCRKPIASSLRFRRRGRRHWLTLAGARTPDDPAAALSPVFWPLLQFRYPHDHASALCRHAVRIQGLQPRAAQTVFQLQRIERWGFDPEILFIALKHGYVVREVPVTWGHDERSRISYLKDGLQMLDELIFIRWNALTGAYRKSVDKCIPQVP